MVKATDKTAKAERCPICKAAPNAKFLPFCSKRCADIDLSRWFSGSYTVPVVELDEKDLDELEQFVEGTELIPDEQHDNEY
jgi:endogenous inhibitor of DNA gyrase (YacG/DUF329 family)